MRMLRRLNNPRGGSANASREAPERDRRRFPIFLLAFLISCAAALIYTYSRPVLYDAAASIEITPSDNAALAQDSEQAARLIGTVRHALTSNIILTKLLKELTDQHPRQNIPRGLGELLTIVDTSQFENTNIAILRAQGPDPEVLPIIVNLWADLYLGTQASTQKISVDDTNAKLVRQASDLRKRVDLKRAAIDYFRKQHDIISMQREENRVLARLKVLNKSFNEAKDAELKAKSNLSTIKDAIRRGKPVVDLQDQRRIANLESSAVKLHEKIEEFEQKYTPKYMALDPEIMGQVRQLKLVQRKIANVRQEARDRALAKAEQDYASTRRSARDLAAELERSKQKVANFTSRFAEYKALTSELAQMEEMYNEVKERQMRRQVDRPPEAIKVSLLQRAVKPARPIWPHYTKDAAISVGASLLLGILAVLFYDFFNRPARKGRQRNGGPVVIGLAERPLLVDALAHTVEPTTPPAALEHLTQRELTETEIGDLFTAADAMTQSLIGVLLVGGAAEEMSDLCWENIDFESNSIVVPGRAPRTLKLPDPLNTVLKSYLPENAEPSAPIWPDQDNDPLELNELDALIACAAHDAHLDDAAHVSTETVRHTYIVFLVRHGVRLSDLGRVIGDLPPSVRASYASYSPPGPSVALDDLQTVHPILENS